MKHDSETVMHPKHNEIMEPSRPHNILKSLLTKRKWKNTIDQSHVLTNPKAPAMKQEAAATENGALCQQVS